MSPIGPGSAAVDAAALVVHVDGQRRPFTIDLATGAVTLGSGASATTVEPLTWREKLTLARFAGAGSRSLDAALITHRLTGDGESPVPESADGRALVALARWVNGFGPGGAAAPLDPHALVQIAARALLATEIAPALLDAMPAADVEMLAVTQPSTAQSAAEPDPSGVDRSAGPDAEDGVVRIVVVPDVEQPGRGAVDGPSGNTNHGDTSSGDGSSADASGPAAPRSRPGSGGGPPRRGAPPAAADLPYLGVAPLTVARRMPSGRTLAAAGAPGDAAGADAHRAGTVAEATGGTGAAGVAATAGIAATTGGTELQGVESAGTRRAGVADAEPPGPAWEDSLRFPLPADRPRGVRGAVVRSRPSSAAPSAPTGVRWAEHRGLSAAAPRMARPDAPALDPAPPSRRSPVPAAAPSTVDRPPTPAAPDVDAVVDELARRLEQAIADLGLDPEG